MGLPTALQNADEEANELIRKQSDNQPPTPSQGNTGEDSKPPQQDGTPEQFKASDSDQTWEHKYRVLQGKYNADTKQLRDDLDRAKSSHGPDPQQEQYIQQLKSDNANLKLQIEQLKAAPQIAIEEVELDKELVDEYSEGFARAVARQAKAGNTEVQQLKDQISKLESKLDINERATQETTASMRERELVSTLTQSNIDFEQVNTDPMFVEWLSGIDEASGETRNTLMNRAYSRGDISRTAYFFNAFKAQEGSRFNNNPLQQHVDVTSRAPGDAAGDDNVWTTEQINKLYDDYNNGKLTREEFEKWERKLYAASAAGKITG